MLSLEENNLTGIAPRYSTARISYPQEANRYSTWDDARLGGFLRWSLLMAVRVPVIPSLT
jgi:hypothetical protein